MNTVTQFDAHCATCPFWSKAPADERPIPMGECRADPPKMFLFPVMTPPTTKVLMDELLTKTQAGLSIIGQAAFPQTSSDQWCGVHPLRALDEAIEGE